MLFWSSGLSEPPWMAAQVLRLEADGVGEHPDRVRCDETRGQQLRDQLVGPLRHPGVDPLPGACAAGDIDGLDIGSVIGSEQIDLVRSSPDRVSPT
jgi:hypothetical protein